MATIFVMPKIGWVMTEGRIVSWLKKEGERVEKDAPLCEVETEKVITEIPSPAIGILAKIISPEGSIVPVGEAMAIIAQPDEDVSEIAIEIAEVISEGKKITKERRKPTEVAIRARISPLAKKLAEEHQVDIKKITGTGPGGRIVKRDVLKAIELAKEHKIIPTIGVSGKAVPLTGKRKIIAERMSYSARTTAHITITTEVDMSETVKLHDKFGNRVDVSVTYTDILVKAVAKALEEHPLLNSIWKEEQIYMIDDINIGVAVAVEDTLIVPVVRHANEKSLTQIALLMKQLVDRAKQNKLSAEEATGSTFTITNLGMFGVDIFTPIINPPENAILGVGRIVEKPVIMSGKTVVRSMMPLSLTFDHRVMDGVPAARFLQRLKQILENPHLLLDESFKRTH